ncbi:hypothetical protein BV20DRAFT_358869 [Pilatotrama ljubarskyi]|nr:hypothetical protein BV20DRAFT_358869 [Pilatotrama ljubarskyi]
MRATFAATTTTSSSSTPARDITPRPEAQLAHSAEASSLHQHPSPGPGSQTQPLRHPVPAPPPQEAPSSPSRPRSAGASPASIDPAATPTRQSTALPSFRHAVYEARTPVASPKPAAAPFENSPEDLIDLLHFDHDKPTYYNPGHASTASGLSMSDSPSTSSTSEHGRQSARGRGVSQYGQARRPPVRPSFQTSAGPLYPQPVPSSASASSQENRPAASASAPQFQGPPPPQYPYGQRGAYVGQYTMSAQPHVSMVHHSPPQYAYPPPHPGLHAPDQSMLSPPHNQLLGYSPSTLMPMMQAHSPVYQFPGHSPESSSSSSRSFSNSPSVFSPHSRPQAHPSPPPHSPLAPQASGPPHAHSGALPPPHSASYAGQTPYSPMRFSTPPFPYPPHSFAPSPSLYAASQYPSHYPQHYPSDQEGQGTWWYLPPQPASGQYESFQSPYTMSYNPANTREGEQSQYGSQPGSSSLAPMFPMSPSHPSGPSPGPSSSSGGQAPYSPPPFSPQEAQYSQLIPEKSPPLPRGRPPEHGPPTMSPASSTSRPTAERPPPARRPYHPNPPAHRSEWVMWTGNVPSDATHDELWRFFNSPPSPGSSVGPTSTHSAPAGPAGSSSSSSSDSLYGGVSSIFLIARSNCAFVNFQSEPHLQAAIRHFNGVPLRPNDPRCPRLVCRVRAREDDLKAGVGAQRGAGMHMRWVRDKKEREREAARRQSTSSSEHVTTASSSPTDPAHMIGSLSLSSDDEGGRGRHRKPEPHSSSSGSYASTNSSILTAYFPKRYFILKSLTQFDLDLSVEKGLWATQRHNEGILDQAYRTSKDVYLIFSVNKSGEFYGYARMAGPIMRGEQRVSWASRTDSPPQRRSSTHSTRDSPSAARRDRDPVYFSPSEQRYGESPFPMSPDTQSRLPPSRPPTEPVERDIASAPAEMLQPHRNLSVSTEAAHGAPSLSFDVNALRPVGPAIMGRKQISHPGEIELDRTAPLRAMRDPRAVEALRKSEEGSLDTVAEEDERAQTEEGRGKGKEVERPDEGEAGERQREEGPVWGEPFKVEWIRTDRLPFTRTRHLRNPWNHDREVKVSRDGTELEPSVGQALLDEWEKLDQAQPQATSSTVEVGRRLQGKASISADVLSSPTPSRTGQQPKEGG